jgi:hypothetical protein
MKTYSNLKELIKIIEEILPRNKKIVNWWQENKYYVFEIASDESVDMEKIMKEDEIMRSQPIGFRLKVLAPI